MTKHYCDYCKEEQNDMMYKIPIMYHVVNGNKLGGHVKSFKDGTLEPISGREVTYEVCLKCYNKIMLPFWESIKTNLLNEKDCD